MPAQPCCWERHRHSPSCLSGLWLHTQEQGGTSAEPAAAPPLSSDKARKSAASECGDICGVPGSQDFFTPPPSLDSMPPQHPLPRLVDKETFGTSCVETTDSACVL